MTDDRVPVPTSLLQPYDPEPSETKRVLALLHYADGTTEVLVTDARILGTHKLIRRNGRIFDCRGDDERKDNDGVRRWYRHYRECAVFDFTPKGE